MKIISYELPIPNWHRTTKMVFDTTGIMGTLGAQSNNEIKKVFDMMIDANKIDWSTASDIGGGQFCAMIEDENGDRRQAVLACRVRKLTPRECFRLMDVAEEDIDKIQAAGISKSQQYKMAGNSIVVSCMVELFRSLFYPTKREPKRGEVMSLF